MDRTVPAPTGIGRLIDERPVSRLQWRVFLLCALVMLLDGYDLQAMPLAVPSLVADWALPRERFGYALSAALVGVGLGAAFLAPLGDRHGRRPVLILAMLEVGIASLATAHAGSLESLIAWRFITGLGMGACIPNATALTSEYAPASRRAKLLTLANCNLAVGAFIAGFLAPPLIAQWGWHGIFHVGGVAPIVLAGALWLWLPESVRFLHARRPQDPAIAAITRRLAPDVAPASVVPDPQPAADRQPFAALFTPDRRLGTALLWTVFALNLGCLYMLMSWLPTLLADAGWPPASALRGGVTIQAGGILGGLALSWYVDRGRTVAAMSGVYAIAVASLALFVAIPAESPVWWLLLVCLGAGTSGAQFALYALAAQFYPPGIRATGVGWATGVGRVGAVLSPLAGGWILAQGVGTVGILGLLIAPLGLCFACILLLPRVWRVG